MNLLTKEEHDMDPQEVDEKDRKLALQKVKLEKLKQEIEEIAQIESKF